LNNTVKNRFSLVNLIIGDLFKSQKLSLLLVGLIVVSAIAILWTTQQTRKQLFIQEQLILERDVLESEWRNLVIEENVLADPKRIEKSVIKLGMEHVSPKNETVIVIKNR